MACYCGRMRFLFLLFLLLPSCALTPSALQKTSDNLLAIGGQFQGTVEQLKEANVIHGKTADKLEAVTGASQDALRQISASLVQAPKKADGTIDFGQWAAGGGVMGAASALLGLYLKTRGSQQQHDDSQDQHSDADKRLAILEAKTGVTVKPS